MENVMSLKRQLMRIQIRKDQNSQLFKKKRQCILEYNKTQEKMRITIKNIELSIQSLKIKNSFDLNQYNQLVSIIQQIKTVSPQYLGDQILNFLVNLTLAILQKKQLIDHIVPKLIKQLNQIFIQFLALKDEIVQKHIQKFLKICQFSQFQNLFINISAIKQWNNDSLRKVYIQTFVRCIEKEQKINLNISQVMYNFVRTGPISSAMCFRFVNYINGVMCLNINKILSTQILTNLFDVLKIVSNTLISSLNIVNCAYIIKQSLQLLNDYNQSKLILSILKLYASLFIFDQVIQNTLKYYPTFIFITRKFLKSSNNQILRIVCIMFCNLATSKCSHEYIFQMVNQFLSLSNNTIDMKIKSEAAIVILNYLHESSLQYRMAFLKQNHVEFLIDLLKSQSEHLLLRTLWVIRILLQSQLLANNLLQQQPNLIQHYIQDNEQILKLIEIATKSKNQKIAQYSQDILLNFFNRSQNTTIRMLYEI